MRAMSASSTKNCIHQDYLSCQGSLVLFFGIENSMFEEVINEHITTEKIITFLQTALMKQNDLQQYIHFHPAANARKEIEPCLSLLLTELYENKNRSLLHLPRPSSAYF